MSPNAGKGRGGVAGSQPMSKAVHRSLNKLWRSNAIFNLCFKGLVIYDMLAANSGKIGRVSEYVMAKRTAVQCSFSIVG